MPLGCSHHQHRGIVLIAGFQIGALHQQQLDGVQTSCHCGGQQRRGSVFEPRIHFGASAQQGSHALHFAGGGSSDQIEISLGRHGGEATESYFPSLTMCAFSCKSSKKTEYA